MKKNLLGLVFLVSTKGHNSTRNLLPNRKTV
jgi:hypothetical protein